MSITELNTIIRRLQNELVFAQPFIDFIGEQVLLTCYILERTKTQDLLPANLWQSFRSNLIKNIRERLQAIATLYPPPPDIHCHHINAYGVPADWISAPDVDSSRIILYLHGGAYVSGSRSTHKTLCYFLSQATNSRILLIEYRLAPEYIFPAAVDDGLTTYHWLINEVKANPAKIAIAGESAGASLTMVTLAALKQAKIPLPGAAVCLSPWVDLECLGSSMQTKAAVDPILKPWMLELFAQMYLNHTNPRHPLASPLYADLSGLPPLLIQVGSSEILLDDARSLAKRAKEEDIEVELQIWDNMIHMWHFFATDLSEAREAIAGIAKFIATNCP